MRIVSTGLIIIMLTLGAGDALAQESAAWREVAAAIPLGSKVKVQRVDGKRYTGALMRVDTTGVLIKRDTRRPEPAITVAFDDMSKIEREHGGGVNVGKAIAIGLATGAGVIFGMFLIALSFD